MGRPSSRSSRTFGSDGEEEHGPLGGVAWDWLGAHLDNGRDLSIYCLYRPATDEVLGRYAFIVDPDGGSTRYDVRAGAYWVPINGLWWQVPEKAIVRNAGNPLGEAVVWYVSLRGNIEIRCFVPACLKL